MSKEIRTLTRMLREYGSSFSDGPGMFKEAADLIATQHKELSALKVQNSMEVKPKAQGTSTGKVHVLKTDPEVFEADLRGDKHFEIRRNDRDFAVNDTLVLCETQHTGEEMRQGAPLVYTGRKLIVLVTHIQSGYGIADGWVGLSFTWCRTLIGHQQLKEWV